MRSPWERYTRSVVALRSAPLALRPVVEKPESDGAEASSQAILTTLTARRPRGAARVEIRGSRRRRLARAIVLDSLGADLEAVARVMVVMARVMVAVARVMEVADAMPEAGAKASPHVEAVAVVIATQLVARAELALLAVALAREALTPAVERAI
eukprot:4468871-Pleurochrysis_carterae.AAC.1